MTDIEKKALALVRECESDYEALCLAIEQHEAFRQKVSDAVVAFRNEWVQATPSRQWFQAKFTRFIIAKPDPLVEALGELADRNMEAEQAAETLRAAIEARGGRIVWEGE